jgi:hypothetical protein
MKQASFWESLSIRCPHVKFSTLYYLRVSAFISLVYKTDYRKAILHGGHKVVVLYMQTHCCIPKPRWVVGKCVGELFVMKNSGQLSMKLYCWYSYSSENKVPVFAMLSSGADTSSLPSKVVAQRMHIQKNVWIHTCLGLVKLAEGSKLP